jgi:xylitol oxidase
VDHDRSTVTVSAGMRYGEFAAQLHESGYALRNLGSLPHISVGGAIATGTHGSGTTVGNLATAVRALQLVTADGVVSEISRDTHGDEFRGAVVGLGALGVVTRVTLDVVPTFQLSQWVYEDLPAAALATDLPAILASGYSVSLFTDWRSDSIQQVWRKVLVDPDEPPHAPDRWYGATLADRARHPIAGLSGDVCTEQLGVPGPWHLRLPHFRMEFTPSAGKELQSEYLLPREHAAAALAALGEIRDRIAPLVQVSEIRTVAADQLWLSPSYGRDTVAIHFTWVPDTAAVGSVLGDIEDRLGPFAPRPHWGKLFATDQQTLAAAYERYADFAALMARYDPTGKFGNELLDRWFPSGS